MHLDRRLPACLLTCDRSKHYILSWAHTSILLPSPLYTHPTGRTQSKRVKIQRRRKHHLRTPNVIVAVPGKHARDTSVRCVKDEPDRAHRMERDAVSVSALLAVPCPPSPLPLQVRRSFRYVGLRAGRLGLMRRNEMRSARLRAFRTALCCVSGGTWEDEGLCGGVDQAAACR
ncbi:hypothetical protein BKA80DRAFT_52589 [Phyllosticta citrichinensis]